MRLLTFSSLYPNSVQTHHGIFVEERLKHLINIGQISATVVAPVPWFPFKSANFGRYSMFAKVPIKERRNGIEVFHPRYIVIPKVGMGMAPSLMYRSLIGFMRGLAQDGHGFDLIDAHYFYPDGVAAVRCGTSLRRPVVITARGSDINVIAKFPGPRRKILQAASQAAAIVTVSRALRERLLELGVDGGKVWTLRNGVDLEQFRPLTSVRPDVKQSSKTGWTWLFVGNLVADKGVDLAIKALSLVENVTLLVVGDGPDRAVLRTLSSRLHVDHRVIFWGSVNHESLCDFYNAADALMLPSRREGLPNVVLEALACGTPVIATRVGGIPEVLPGEGGGILIDERTPEVIVSAWEKLRSKGFDRALIRKYAEQFGWASTVRRQTDLYEDIRSKAERASG